MQSSVTKKSSDALEKTAPLDVKYWRQWAQAEWIRLNQDTVLANRTMSHLILISIAALAVGMGQLELAWGTISAVRPLRYDASQAVNAEATEGAPEIAALSLPSELSNAQDDTLMRVAVPKTIIPDRSRPQPAIRVEQQIQAVDKPPEIQIYSVQSGDTISGIAEKFGLSTDTLVWANDALERNPDLLYVGQELNILPVDGAYHLVESGDTIDSIATKYKVDAEAIINYPLNELNPETLIIVPGQRLVVPDGDKPFVPRTVVAYSGPVPDDAAIGSGLFGWPASGSITNGYYGYHPGLDIGGWIGAPILASDSGHVILAGWDNTGYGNMVVIDHGNGFQTVYAHMNAFYVADGDDVSKGQQIGEMGSTGNSTGPHLHFEIRQSTIQRNPYGFLP